MNMREFMEDLGNGLFEVFGPIIAVLVAIAALTLGVVAIFAIPAAILLHIIQSVRNTSPY